MKNKKLNESVANFPFENYLDGDGEAAFNIIFNLDYFIRNAKKIIDDFRYYGNCVLQDKNKAYGLLFKDNSGDEEDVYMKAHVYRWPQYGVINGGKTFYPGTKNFGEELKKAIPYVR